MGAFKEYLNETKLLGKLKPYEKKLFMAYVDFLKEYFHQSKEVEISFRKPSARATFGYIDLVAFSKGKYKIIVENNFSLLLGHIAHEYTHVSQYLNGYLDFNKDQTQILWKKEPYISIKDLNKVMKDRDMVTYKNLPWEAEAYKNQDKLPDVFKSSPQFKELKDNAKDATLIFVLDNL